MTNDCHTFNGRTPPSVFIVVFKFGGIGGRENIISKDIYVGGILGFGGGWG